MSRFIEFNLWGENDYKISFNIDNIEAVTPNPNDGGSIIWGVNQVPGNIDYAIAESYDEVMRRLRAKEAE